MIVAFDNTFLTLVLNPNAPPRPNPIDGKPVTHCKQKIDALIDEIWKAKGQVIVPMPCVAEAMCATPDMDKVIPALRSYSAIDLVPFDARSAIEFAIIMRRAFESGDKRSGIKAEWQTVKIDRQIVSIAKAHGASKLYTDDENQAAFARLADLEVVRTWELELPAAYAQMNMLEHDEKR